MSSLSRNLKQLFAFIAAIALALLVWSLLDLWDSITERHEIRQRSQIATLASATQTMMASQEMVLDLLGRQLLVDELVDDPAAAVVLLDRMLEINPVVAGYGLASRDGELLVVNSQFERHRLPNLLAQPASRDSFVAALDAEHMVVGRPYLVTALDAWVIPVRKAIRDADGRLLGVMTAGLHLDGPAPFFDEQTFLGPRNTVQIVRDEDLYPLHYAATVAPPADYYNQPIPRAFYADAIGSAERRSGLDIEQIKANAEPYSYRNVNAQGPQFGMAVYDPRYDYWVLTQTHRDQLLLEFARVAWVYVAVFGIVLLGIFWMLRTIGSAERMRQRDLLHQAGHDALTALPNRQRMTEDFDAMREAHDDRFALLFVDMDNFKAVNDGFGHVQGDSLLREMGARLRRFATGDERVARIGGDEFVVLTPKTDPETLTARARALIERLTLPYMVNGVRCQLGCSIGIATVADAGESLSDVLRAADVAMYAAKRERNSVRFYDPSMGRDYLENIRIEQRLRDALATAAIRMAYQPQVDADGRVVGVEALARWRDDELGTVDPRRFIAIAEASGFINELGDYIADRVFDDAWRMRAHFPRRLRLAINISIRQFVQPDFARRLVERVERAGLPQVLLVVEITESLFMEDQRLVFAELERLRAAGIRVSLDDFGTGYSSLALLRTLPVDELKIDKSFIDHVESDPNTRKLVQSVVAIGKNHGMSTVAEGIEQQSQFELLRADGCDTFQGYLFARPMPPDELIDYLERAR
jgi:diguanylate cyclase (GGDEF)-like protein